MNTSHTYTVRRAAAALLAMMVLLSLSGGLAMGMGTPQQQAVSITLHYMLDGAAMTQPAEPLPYPGYESAFWLYIGPEAQADPNATLDVSDVSGRFQYGFSLQPGTPASTLYQYNADGALSGQYLPFYPLGSNSETLNEYEYRLYISLSAPVYQPPETPVQPVDITVYYRDKQGNQVADTQVIKLGAGSHSLVPSPVNLLPGHELIGPQSGQVEVGPDGASPEELVFIYRLIPPVSRQVDVVVSYVDEAGQRVASDTVFTAGEGKHSVPAAPRDLKEGYALMPGEDAAKYVTITQNTATPASLQFVYRMAESATATPTYEYDFKKFRWGDSQDQVRLIEGEPFLANRIPEQNTDYIAYRTRAVGLDMILAYYFNEDRLYQVRYILDEKHSNEDLYIDDYTIFRTAMTKKYGKPLLDLEKWQDDSKKDYYINKKGDALSYGYLSYLTRYLTDRTFILMKMDADNYEVSMTINYTSKDISPGEPDYSDDI